MALGDSGEGSTVERTEEDALVPALAGVVGYVLRQAHGVFQSYWMAHFKGSDQPITPVQGGMLVLVAANPGLTQAELARAMNVEGPSLIQSVDRLERQGYLQRDRRAGDRRSYALRITPHGEAMLAAVNAFVPIRQDDLMAALTPEEQAELADYLRRIVLRGHRLKPPRPGSAAAPGAKRSRTP